MANTVDPVAGAYAIEARTNEIEREATAVLNRIEAVGGTLGGDRVGHHPARDSGGGVPDATVHRRAAQSVVVGVNRFQSDEGAAIPIFRVDPDIERAQRARVAAVRATRDARAWRAAIEGIRAAARGDPNLVPLVIAAVQAKATVGEISDVMRDVFGEAPLV